MDLLFPSVVSTFKDKNFYKYNRHIIKYCYTLRKITKGVQKSNALGWHSEDDVHLRDDFTFLNKITELIELTLRDLHLKSCSVSLNSLWININPRWSYNHRHIHPNNHLSGIFYLKVPKNSGDLVFVNDNMQANTLHKFFKDDVNKTIKSYPTFKYTPEEGRMFLFDSTLPHRVEQNLSHEDRISLSFNIDLL